MIVLVNKGQEEFEDTKRVTRIRKSKDRQQMPKSCVHKREHFQVPFGTLYIYTCLIVFRPSKNKQTIQFNIVSSLLECILF
jgi:hypothetical protein